MIIDKKKKIKVPLNRSQLTTDLKFNCYLSQSCDSQNCDLGRKGHSC